MGSTKSQSRFAFILIAAAGLALAGCSGGGGSGGGGAVAAPPQAAPPPPPPTSTAPQWTPGVYEPASTFKDRCEVPRVGVDLAGDPFPDTAGSTTIENFWLRSWTEETYLWNDEVADRDPARFSDRLEYFDLLKTEAITASGAPKDDFHFTQPTEEFLRQRLSAPSASYGVSYAIISARPPRDIRVRYTDPNTPAARVVGGKANFIRGARILRADGLDVVDGGDEEAEIDAINAALFPETAGESHRFQVRDPDGTQREVTLVSENLSRAPVNRLDFIDTPSGPVAYLLFNTFSPFEAERALVDAFEAIAEERATDLVLDLRYNGGGLLAVSAQLGYMIAGPEVTRGQTFEQLRFNNGIAAVNPVTGRPNDPIPFFEEALGFSVDEGTALPTLRLPRVFVLTTEDTCSASESLVNSLRGVDYEVVLIGDTTCGKPYGFYPQDNCGVTYYTIQFQGVNDKGFGDYANGFAPMNADAPFAEKIPGCLVADDLNAPLGAGTEPLLAAALQYRETGTCPAPPPMSSFGSGDFLSGGLPVRADGRALTPPASVFERNRDMRLPRDGGDRQ